MINIIPMIIDTYEWAEHVFPPKAEGSTFPDHRCLQFTIEQGIEVTWDLKTNLFKVKIAPNRKIISKVGDMMSHPANAHHSAEHHQKKSFADLREPVLLSLDFFETASLQQPLILTHYELITEFIPPGKNHYHQQLTRIKLHGIKVGVCWCGKFRCLHPRFYDPEWRLGQPTSLEALGIDGQAGWYRYRQLRNEVFGKSQLHRLPEEFKQI